MLDLSTTRQKIRRGAMGAVGVGAVAGWTIDAEPGVVLVLLGAIALVADERLTRSAFPWGDE